MNWAIQGRVVPIEPGIAPTGMTMPATITVTSAAHASSTDQGTNQGLQRAKMRKEYSPLILISYGQAVLHGTYSIDSRESSDWCD